MGQGAFSSQPRLHPFSPAAARPPRLTQGGSVRLYAPLSLLLAAHSSTAAALGCHGNVMQAGRGGGVREAPGDVCAPRSSSLAASQFFPILEESRSPSADALALAPF
jgi:hypothetical protein